MDHIKLSILLSAQNSVTFTFVVFVLVRHLELVNNLVLDLWLPDT